MPNYQVVPQIRKQIRLHGNCYSKTPDLLQSSSRWYMKDNGQSQNWLENTLILCLLSQKARVPQIVPNIHKWTLLQVRRLSAIHMKCPSLYITHCMLHITHCTLHTATYNLQFHSDKCYFDRYYMWCFQASKCRHLQISRNIT